MQVNTLFATRNSRKSRLHFPYTKKPKVNDWKHTVLYCRTSAFWWEV